MRLRYNSTMKKTLIFSILAVALFQQSFAQTQSEVEQAIKLTQEMLKDPDARDKEIGKGADKKAADQKVKDVAGSEANEQAIYELAASVFGTLMSETGGDVEKVQEMLAEGMKNPESFAKKWSPEELAKLKKISNDVPKQSETSSPKTLPQKSTTYRPPVKK